MRASAPMMTPSTVTSTPASGSALISTTVVGASTPSFIRSISVVPPAMKRAPVGRTSSSAFATSPAATYSNGCIVGPVVRAADRRQDVRIRAASTEIPAHRLAQLVVGVGAALRDDAHRGHDLPGRAIAALK